jgi:hypothetical protein
MASPKKLKRGILVPTTPAKQEPLCMPMRMRMCFADVCSHCIGGSDRCGSATSVVPLMRGSRTRSVASSMSAAMASMRTVWSVAPSLPATTMYAAQDSRTAASGAARAAQSVRAAWRTVANRLHLDAVRATAGGEASGARAAQMQAALQPCTHLE